MDMWHWLDQQGCQEVQLVQSHNAVAAGEMYARLGFTQLRTVQSAKLEVQTAMVEKANALVKKYQSAMDYLADK